MVVDEMKLIGELGEVKPLPAETFEQARTLLQAAIAVEGAPQIAELARRPKRRRRMLAVRGGIGAGVAAAAAAIALAATSLGQAPLPAASNPAGSSHVASPLVRLADYITTNAPQPAGNATLVIRTTTYPGQTSSSAADLYTDSGDYYYAPSETGLPAEIAAKNDRSGGMYAREVAAAIDAVNGNLATAREKMVNAPFAPGTQPATPAPPSDGAQPKVVPVPAGGASPQVNIDNYLWEDSMGALVADAGNPQVRAGVLRLLSTLPEVTVTDSTTGGQPTLTLTAAAPAVPTNYQEALTINANTGVPVDLVGGTPGQTPSVTITYQVSRVTVANIAAGRF